MKMQKSRDRNYYEFDFSFLETPISECQTTPLPLSPQGGAIRQKNSRQVILLRDTADISGLDRQIF